MPRIALSGIPTHFERSIVGHHEHVPVYRDSLPPISTRDDLELEMAHITNTGNYLISEGVRRALNQDSTTYISFSRLSGEEADSSIEHLNANFDFLVFATANIFNASFSPTVEAEVLAKVNIPIVLMSPGIQQRSEFGDSYPASFAPLMDVLTSKEVYAFTRGHYTAEFLRQHGVKWVQPVGCPSIYAYPENMCRSFERLKDLETFEDLRIVHSGYLGSVADTIVDIRELGGSQPAEYVVQDEYALFDFEIAAEPGQRAYDEATGLIVAPVSFPRSGEISRPVNYRVFFNPERWRAWVSELDLAFGRRFHGMVMAAQAGTPSLMISVDDRTREMLEFAAFPHFQFNEWNPARSKQELLKTFVERIDMPWHIDRYRVCEAKFRKLIAEVGLV